MIKVWDFGSVAEEMALRGTRKAQTEHQCLPRSRHSRYRAKVFYCHRRACRPGHGDDVRCVDWHPYKALIASGSRDNLVKLWDPKSGKTLTTLCVAGPLSAGFRGSRG